MNPRFQGQNCKFFTTPLSRNFQKRPERKENQTKYRKMTLYIQRGLFAGQTNELYQWSRRCVRGAAATQAMSAFHLPNQTLMISGITKRKWNDIVLLKRSVFNRIETIHLRFGRNFDSSLAKWDWKRKFLEVEREVSVGLNQPSKRTTSGGGPFSPKNFYAHQSVQFIFRSKFPKILV